MFDGNWHGKNYDDKLGWRWGLIAFALTLIFWFPYSQKHAFERQQAANYEKRLAIEACTELPTTALIRSCISTQKLVGHDQSTVAYNLKAQQDIAEWSLLVFILTIIGVVLLYRTLKATDETLLITQKTLVSTNEGSIAAVRTANIARSEFEHKVRRSRPRLYLKSLTAHIPLEDHGRWRKSAYQFDGLLANSGPVTALNIEIFIALTVDYTRIGGKEDPFERRSYKILFADQDRFFKSPGPFGEKEDEYFNALASNTEDNLPPIIYSHADDTFRKTSSGRLTTGIPSEEKAIAHINRCFGTVQVQYSDPFEGLESLVCHLVGSAPYELGEGKLWKFRIYRQEWRPGGIEVPQKTD